MSVPWRSRATSISRAVTGSTRLSFLIADDSRRCRALMSTFLNGKRTCIVVGIPREVAGIASSGRTSLFCGLLDCGDRGADHVAPARPRSVATAEEPRAPMRIAVFKHWWWHTARPVEQGHTCCHGGHRPKQASEKRKMDLNDRDGVAGRFDQGL